MKLLRRNFLLLAAGAAAMPVISRVAWAQSYPAHPVQWIVGFPPGSGPDIATRLIGQWLSERLGQQVVVEDRPGAGGTIATAAVVHAAPDGYSLLCATSANAVNATFYPNLKFDFVRDIAPVASIGNIPFVMVVNPLLSAKSVPEFIDYAKANPSKINVASAGTGSVSHVSGELFKAMAGLDWNHVPYRISFMPDLLSGQVQAAFTTITLSIEYIRAGKLRALAVTSPTRSMALPDIPTVGEFVQGYDATGWYGVGAPKSTSADIVDKLNREVNAGLADTKLKARLADVGVEPTPMTPAEFGRLIADDTEKWRKVIKAANIQPE
jgi:tripartite-type tricarboxylate transporter receptor subunit TctC